MRDEHYDPFRQLPPTPRPLEAVVFVLAPVRGDQTDSMRGEAVYTLNSELYRALWFASEALARADLATQQDALAAVGWTTVAFAP